MRVLVACEYSGRVRDAFRDQGHDAWSCDILPTEGGRPEYNQYHYQKDVFEVIALGGWDLMVAFPPCTYLTVAGARHWRAPGRAEKRQEAHDFFLALYNAPITRVAVENPVGYMNTAFRKPDQIIHPYYFGEPHMKRTCLWLRNLPLLTWEGTPVKPPPVAYDKGGKKPGKARHFTDNPGMSVKNRAHLRSATFLSVARAMAEQWGTLDEKSK